MENGIPTIGELLFEHHQNYEKQIRKVVSQKEFADYVGINDKNYNHFYVGRRKPSKKIIVRLAKFFNKPSSAPSSPALPPPNKKTKSSPNYTTSL